MILNEAKEVVAESKAVAPTYNQGVHIYGQYCLRTSKTSHTCKLCRVDISTSDDKASNLYDHIVSVHSNEVIPLYQNIDEATIDNDLTVWKRKEETKDSKTKPTTKPTTKVGMVQSKFGDNAYKKTVSNQKKAIVRSICLGYLPLTSVHNPG